MEKEGFFFLPRKSKSQHFKDFFFPANMLYLLFLLLNWKGLLHWWTITKLAQYDLHMQCICEQKKKKKVEDRILQTNFHLIWKGFVLFVFRLGLNISLHSPTVLINHKGNLTSLRNVSLVPTTSYVLIPSVLRVKTGMVNPTFLHIQRINHWYRFTSVNTRSFQIIFERCMPGRK